MCVQRQVPISNTNANTNVNATANVSIPIVGQSDNVDVTAGNKATEKVHTKGLPPFSSMKEGTTTTLTASTIQSDLFESMTNLLQAQTQMLAAQAQAVTVQTLPPLARFNGEESRDEDNTFDRWIERFEE